ncbi:hypothetical protein HGRIS_001926 [Hohenbuehelia grisea]|uniref:Uncharacterized protein n=1 Tax=Hohenbuehelia grisea TaxID=104357 RepID=A0ABR3JKP3_9AGAR
MPPRTRSRVKVPNSNSENIAPSKNANSTSKHVSTKQVLQDITGQFTPNASATGKGPNKLENEGSSPTKPALAVINPKRKAKQSIQLPLKASQPRSAPISSLPPSSPPSLSSRFGYAGYEGDVSMEAGAAQEDELAASDDFGANLRDGIATDDFAADDDFQFEVGEDEFTHPANLSDPFGFLAAENILKAHREARAPSIDLNENLSVNIPIDDDHPTPHPDGTEHSLHTNSPLHTPATPHRPRRKRKSMITHTASGEEIFSPRTESMPSTPSPSKPSVLSDRMLSDFERSLGDIAMITDTPSLQLDAKATRKGPPAKKKLRSSDESISPTAAAMNLEALMPKRRTRSAAVKAHARPKRAGAKFVDSSDEEMFDDIPKPKIRARKPASKKGVKRGAPASTTDKKGKGKQVLADSEEEPDLDINKLEQERQARLEFFKKLESYKLAEENVYVI